MAYDPTYVRGKSAIVGIAESVSPTGVLGILERDLEVKMILEALDDAGLKLSDVDGLLYWHDVAFNGFGRAFGYCTPIYRQHHDRWFKL